MRLLIPDPVSPQSYDIIRALASRAENIIALIPARPWFSAIFCPAALSLRVTRRYRVSLPPEVTALSIVFNKRGIEAVAEKYVAQVLEICRRERISLIYPSCDEYVLLFSLFKKIFHKNGIEIPVNDFAILCRVMDKREVIALAGQAGIDVPRTVSTTQEWGDVFPVLSKPRFGSAGQGQDIISTSKKLDEWRQTKQRCGQFILQEVIPGGRIMYLRIYMDAQGTIHAASYAENNRPGMKLHQTRALLLESLPVPEAILEKARHMLHKLKYVGYCHVQMKFDARDQKAKVMEVNARISRGTWTEYSGLFNPVEKSRTLIKNEWCCGSGRMRGDSEGVLYVWPLQDFTIFLFLLGARLRIFFSRLRGDTAERNNVPSWGCLWHHYAETYFSRKKKRVDNYTRHGWHDPLPAIGHAFLFALNNIIRRDGDGWI